MARWMFQLPKDNPEGEMTLGDHIVELRARLLRAIGVMTALFLVAFIYNQPIADLLLAPYCQLPQSLRTVSAFFDDNQCRIIFTDVFGGLMVRVLAAGAVAVVLGMPYAMYQLWAFVVPGLKKREKRWSIPFIVLSHILFAAGAVFAYVTIPMGLEILLQFGGQDYVSLLDAQRYVTFILQVTLAFGLSFEYPLLLAILVLMGVVGPKGLTSYRKHAMFLSFVAAAIITPTQDPFTMIIMAIPLTLFYESVIIFAKIVDKRRAREASEG